MKKKPVMISSVAIALGVGGYVGYVQMAPQYIAQPPLISKEKISLPTSHLDKVATQLALNYKLKNFSQEMSPKLVQNDKVTKEYIYQKQTELVALFREIQSSPVVPNDTFLEQNKQNQYLFADGNRELLSSALAYSEDHSKENRDRIAKASDTLTKRLDNLTGEMFFKEVSSRYHMNVVQSQKTTISYKEGFKLHYIETE